MPRAKPWLKMWVEWLDDPKMLRLTLAEQACWWRLISLARRCDAGGSIVTSSGSPLTSGEVAACLHITSPDDVAAFNSMLKKMETEGSLSWNNNTLHVVHFMDRQEMVASDTPEAIRERVQRYRQRQRLTEKALPPFQTPLTKDIDKEGEGEEEDRRYVTAGNPLHHSPSNGKSVTTPLSLVGEGFTKILPKLSGWLFDEEDDKKWVADFLDDFPDADLMTLKACAEYHSSKQAANKGVWKNRFRNWLKHERQWLKEKEKIAAAEKEKPIEGLRMERFDEHRS